jgi:molecular chaperone GrpE
MKTRNKKHNFQSDGKEESAGEEAKNATTPSSEGHEEGQGAFAETPPPPASAPVAADPALVEKKAAEDRYLRLLADFENFRKRTLREKNEIYRVANEELIQELLPVLDHMDLALEAAQAAQAHGTFLEGFKIVAEQLMAAIKKSGVAAIEAEGQAFDPTQHEAISHLASDTVAENTVIKQVRRGYVLGSKLLRPAQVVVSSGPAKPDAASPVDENAENGKKGE